MLFRYILAWSIFATCVFAQLPGQIENMIMKSGISTGDISISIKESGAPGKTIASLNPDIERIPASVIKIATTYAGLLELGSDYRWKTVVYSTDNVSDGVVDGNLYIKGYGDPAFETSDVIKIVEFLKSRGIRSISGDIIMDRSYFESSNSSSANFDEHPYNPYNAMPDAMMFNQNTTTLSIKGNSVSSDVADKSYEIDNRLKSVNRQCSGKYSWPSARVITSSPKPIVVLSGQISSRCSPRKVTQIVTKSYLACYYSFAEQLNSAGIRFSGGLKLGKVPSNANEIIVYYSKPFMEIISETAKESNNLFARQIFLTLGANSSNATGTLVKSRKAMTDILSRHGVHHASMIKADNGSGLSRSARATSAAFESLLDNAYSKYNSKWMETLSIAGIDGTIKRRFPSSLHHRVWMKTGTVKGVKNIAGYVRSKSGTVYTVVILINSPKARYRGAKLANEIIEWLGNGTYSEHIDKPKIKADTTISDSKKKVASNKHFIQVGTFKGTINPKLLKKIKSTRLNYRLISTANGTKVLVGPFANKQDAKLHLNKVHHSISPKAFIVTF
ncbi:MAG: D-alanyl-D-alanine carboxypeptidase/D-alanyl-D-alanine-endopeptidase [Sulfurovaceae bacterium]|nr:D-alanyl-D-alanine carboxypeptidase/D-alanyl-D-alanine-endopeptidase [Sulfurovaceae bacterium]